jgi:flagellar hook assembly protein FlgD
MTLALLLSGCRSSILNDPSTSIAFAIPEPSHAKLTVENGYNTVVATLVDGDLPTGYHQAVWDASGQLSGIYFYTLELRGTSSNYYSKVTKHLILLK